MPIQVDVKFGRNWADAEHSWEEMHSDASNPQPLFTSAPTAEMPVSRVRRSSPESQSRVLEDSAAVKYRAPSWPAAVAGAFEARTGVKLPQITAIEPTASADGIAAAKTVDDSGAADGEFAHIPLADLIGKPLNRSGKILCPFHDDRSPSLHIYDDHFFCFSCRARGDHVDWLMMVEGKSRAEAEQIFRAWNGPVVRPRSNSGVDESILAFALQIWRQTQPLAYTSAIRYLTDVRGIDVSRLPAGDTVLRFHPNCPFGSGVRYPCLIALYRDVVTDAPAGIHRIALTPDVFTGGKVQRRTLGHWPAPRAIKLWPATDRLFLGEGIETVLAAATQLSYYDEPMLPAWAAGSANNITKFPVIDEVQKLILLVDHDPNGEKCADECRQTWRAAGHEVAQVMPDQEGMDFNDFVQAGGGEIREG